MSTIVVNPSQVHVECPEGANLLDVLMDAQVAIDNPCNGKGTCGKCKVRVLQGECPPASDTEKKLLQPEELEAGVRLACVMQPTGDLTVEVAHKERKHEVLTTGIVPDFDFDVRIAKRLAKVSRPTLEDQTPFEQQLCDQLGVDAIDASVLASTALAPGPYTAVLCDGVVIGLEEGDTTASMYGLAIDIGTTTVVCELVDMQTGEALAHVSQINAQKVFGLDVLTRITYELEHPDDGIANLQKAMVRSLDAMVGDVCQQANVARSQVYEIVVGANCTMMHMLLGVDARSIGKAPFAPVFASAKDLPASSIGISAAPGARLYCMPHVSAYIGADIVAGAYVCGLEQEPGNVLFIDIGTNGEIVLAHEGHLLSCSCAAGPALEGMNISAGMRAAEGAIEEISITPERNEFTIIGDAEPAGLCGSGILAVMRELLRTGLVRKNGAFVKPERLADDDWRRNALVEADDGKRAFLLTQAPERLLVTQNDVRQVQLAKGAILSGFVALLNRADIQMADLDKVVVAGQFGAHLSPDSLTGTGILPPEVEDLVVYAGNTSKTGAYMALMSQQAKCDMQRLAHEMDYLELGATEGYERLFTDCMIFPEYR